MRKTLIAANWKMNTTITEAAVLARQVCQGLAGVTEAETVLCPPFISLTAVKEAIADSNIELGAQNVFYEACGAYTGEVSPPMLAGLCRYVIIGHSERRRHFCETNQIVHKKLLAATQCVLKPILCIGESLAERESGRTESVLAEQLAALEGLACPAGMAIAYEPVWAIGSGQAATSQIANEAAVYIRSVVRRYDARLASRLRILYGGSVSAANIAEFVGCTEIDGALVGGASLKAGEFVDIVRKAAEAKSSG